MEYSQRGPCDRSGAIQTTASTTRAAWILPDAAIGTSAQRNPGLDGIRGLAILAVTAYHLGHLRGGFLGVDLFFVLSGYLITSILLREQATSGSVALTGFWSRRARRILPALLVMVFGVSLLAWRLEPSVRLAALRGSAVASLSFLANWHDIFAGHDYSAPFETQQPLGHLWSLAVEEQFYLIWPVVFVALYSGRWSSRRSVFRVCVLLAVFSAFLSIAVHNLGTWPPSTIFEATPTRAGAILIGAAFAAWEPAERSGFWLRIESKHNLLGWIALLSMISIWMLFDVSSSLLYEGGFFFVGIGSVALIWSATSAKSSPGILRWPPLRWVGLISYGLYLWQWPLFLYVDSSRTNLHGASLDVVRLLLLLLVAVGSYFIVEQPFQSRRIPKGIGVLGAMTAAVLVTVLAVTAGSLAAPQGFEAQMAPERGGGASGPPILVVGDSVSGALAQGMQSIAGDYGVTVINGAVAGCNLMQPLGRVRAPSGEVIPESLNIDCMPRWSAEMTVYHPSTVAMLFGGYALGTVEIDGDLVDTCSARFQSAANDRLKQARNLLTQNGTRLFLVTSPTPDVSRMLGIPFEQEFADRYACWNEVLFSFASRHRRSVEAVDLASYLCPHTWPCRSTFPPDGDELRIDGLHFQGTAGSYVARWVLPRLLRDR